MRIRSAVLILWIPGLLIGCSNSSGDMPKFERQTGGQFIVDTDRFTADPHASTANLPVITKDDPRVVEIDRHLASLEKKTDRENSRNPAPFSGEIMSQITRIEQELRHRGHQETLSNIAIKLDESVSPTRRVRINEAADAYIASHSH